MGMIGLVVGLVGLSWRISGHVRRQLLFGANPLSGAVKGQELDTGSPAGNITAALTYKGGGKLSLLPTSSPRVFD